MTQNEQIEHFYDAVQKCVERTAAEYDLPAASIIGVLEMVKMNVHAKQMRWWDDGGEPPDEAWKNT